MKLCCCFGVLWALGVACAHAAAPQLEPVQLFGADYIRLQQWAAANRFKIEWTTPEHSVRAKTTWCSMDFTVDSRKMAYNGVNVWLSAPVAFARGQAHVGAADFRTALYPLLYPVKTPKTKVKTICIDPGHGGKDPGNQDGKLNEKNYTLLLARELKKVLQKAGFTVVLTRNDDSFVELSTRTETAKTKKADLLVSLHFNASGGSDSSVKGVEVYCMTPAHASSTNAKGEGADSGAFAGNKNDRKNMLLAYTLQKTMVRQLKAEDRGVHRARFAVLREAAMPAVLIEGGFLSNAGEAKKINDADYRRRLAQAISQGILAYKKAVE